MLLTKEQTAEAINICFGMRLRAQQCRQNPGASSRTRQFADDVDANAKALLQLLTGPTAEDPELAPLERANAELHDTVEHLEQQEASE